MTLLETVRRYLEMAREGLEIAELTYEKGHFRGAVHDAYYAMFYAATAALSTKELFYKKHSAVISNFNLIFVHEEKVFPRELANAFDKTFKDRMHFDYEPTKVPREKADAAPEGARKFVGIVVPYVEKWLETAKDKKP